MAQPDQSLSAVPGGGDGSVPKLSIVLVENPSTAERQFLVDQIRAFNDRVSPHHREYRAGFETLGIWVRDASGEILAGLTADLYWGWLFVDDLWVHESLRRQRYGSELLRRAETEALKRGCTRSWLRTFSFQARGFYERHGYRVVGQLDDYPPGETFYTLRKDLRAAEGTTRGSGGECAPAGESP